MTLDCGGRKEEELTMPTQTFVGQNDALYSQPKEEILLK